jgi:hypothetical protein
MERKLPKLLKELEIVLAHAELALCCQRRDIIHMRAMRIEGPGYQPTMAAHESVLRAMSAAVRNMDVINQRLEEAEALCDKYEPQDQA